MRSFKRLSQQLANYRPSARGVAAAAFGALVVAGSVTLMNNVLVRWDSADYERLHKRHAVSRLAKPDTIRVLTSVAKVKDAFSSAGYHLDAVRRGQVDVPRVQRASLPYDLPKMRQAQERKTVFLRYMLPYILEANNKVRKQRERLLKLWQKRRSDERLGEGESAWLASLFTDYRVKPGEFSILLSRVDTVPVSLALAQAAVESGWGTSRFAQEGNAPFGQWTTTDNAGMVPQKREEGLTHKVRSFDSLEKSVEAYLRNLNTHRAYRTFRKLRSAFRKKDEPVDSLAIAETLTAYSEKGKGYVELLKHIITTNELRALDSARLGDSVVVFRPDA